MLPQTKKMPIKEKTGPKHPDLPMVKGDEKLLKYKNNVIKRRMMQQSQQKLTWLTNTKVTPEK